MLDRERILAKLDELDGYLAELRQILPKSFAEYRHSIAHRRATERLLQISIECILDLCSLLVAGLRLGLPAEEEDLITSLERAQVIPSDIAASLKRMKGFRNIVVHEYGDLDDAAVYKIATTRVEDFAAFKQAVLHTFPLHGKS